MPSAQSCEFLWDCASFINGTFHPLLCLQHNHANFYGTVLILVFIWVYLLIAHFIHCCAFGTIMRVFIARLNPIFEIQRFILFIPNMVVEGLWEPVPVDHLAGNCKIWHLCLFMFTHRHFEIHVQSLSALVSTSVLLYFSHVLFCFWMEHLPIVASFHSCS